MARQFNGSSDLINCGPGQELDPPSITILCWVYPTVNTTDYMGLACRSSSSIAVNGEWIFGCRLLRPFVYDSFGSILDPGLGNPTTGTQNAWNMFGFSIGPAAGLTSYLNGLQYGNVAAGPLGSVGPYPFYVGFNPSSGGGGSQYLSGSMAEVCVWNTELTASEVSKFYFNGVRGGDIRPNNIVGYWPLERDLRDYSGNNNHGFCTGTAPIASPQPSFLTARKMRAWPIQEALNPPPAPPFVFRKTLSMLGTGTERRQVSG